MTSRTLRGRLAARTTALALAGALTLTGCGLFDGGSEPVPADVVVGGVVVAAAASSRTVSRTNATYSRAAG